MANKNAIIIGVVVVIVAVVAIAAFALNNNNDKNETRTLEVGDSMTYEVFGTAGDDGTLIDGTVTMKILDETDTQYKYETEQSIYTVATDGTRTALNVGKTTDWKDKVDDDMVSKGTLTVNTFWGEKKLSHYESKDGTEHELRDGAIAYGGMFKSDNLVMYMELTDCTAIKDKKVDREIHEATIVMSGNAIVEGYSFTMTMTCTIDNKETEMFKKSIVKGEFALKDDPSISQEIVNKTTWSNPFEDGMGGMVKTGTERIDTVWGSKETDVYKQVTDGQSYTYYAYKEIPVRMVIEATQMTMTMTMTMDATSIIVDGKSVTLEEAAKI